MNVYISASDFYHDWNMIKENFSYSGAMALYEWIDELNQDIGTPDAIVNPNDYAIEFSEYKTDEIVDYANSMNDDTVREFTTVASAINWLNEQTQVIEFDGGIIVAGF